MPHTCFCRGTTFSDTSPSGCFVLFGRLASAPDFLKTCHMILHFQYPGQGGPIKLSSPACTGLKAMNAGITDCRRIHMRSWQNSWNILKRIYAHRQVSVINMLYLHGLWYYFSTIQCMKNLSSSTSSHVSAAVKAYPNRRSLHVTLVKILLSKKIYNLLDPASSRCSFQNLHNGPTGQKGKSINEYNVNK